MTRHLGGIVSAILATALLGACASAPTTTGEAASSPAETETETETEVEVLDREPDATEGTAEGADAAEPAAEEADDDPAQEGAFSADAPVTSASTTSGLSVTAPEGFVDTPALREVDAEVTALRNQGRTVSVMLTDLGTGREISYDADEPLYPASCAKAIYCCALMERDGGSAGRAALVEDCLVNSSNTAYQALYEENGISLLRDWLAGHDAPVAAENARTHYYPLITARELAAAWEGIWRFGTSGEPGGSELAGYLSRTGYTPLGELLRERCEVWAKPGWYPADENDLASTNDAGVVFSDCGTYVVAVMTDVSADLDALTPLLSALDAAHTVMCGGAA